MTPSTPVLAPTAPPTVPPRTVVAAVGGPEERPCAVCGRFGPISFDTPGSWWPWHGRRRICPACLHRIDHPDEHQKAER